jgi:hypothetical protein
MNFTQTVVSTVGLALMAPKLCFSFQISEVQVGHKHPEVDVAFNDDSF